MKKVLVTGACGFIGTNLCISLLNDGYEVVGVDSFTNNYSQYLKKVNSDLLNSYPFFYLHEIDLLQVSIESLLVGVDTVFHFAGHPSVQNSWGNEFQIYSDRNLVLTQLLLRASVDSGIQKFVNSSSSSVYGRVSTTPTYEYDEKRPVSPYGVTKLGAENLVTLFGSEFGLNTVSLRYFTVYGPRQRPDMAFSKLIHSAFNNTEFPLHGDGSQIRDFTYVQDVVWANRLAADSSLEPGIVMNIGGGSPVSMIEAIAKIEVIMNTRIRIRREPIGPGNPMITTASCKLANDLIGWSPSVNIYDGLKMQIDWQTNQ